MSIWESFTSALQMLFSPEVMLAFFLILPYSLISGAVPLTNLPMTIVLLGFIGVLDPVVSIVLVVAKQAQSDVTEPLPAIMMGIPGSQAAQATVMDGYPLARKGRPAYALGVSYTSTLVGGTLGAISLLIVLPFAREVLKMFSAAEFFLFAVMGVTAVSVISSGAWVKGMLTAALGFLIASIGYSNLSGLSRANFGIEYLWDGISIVPIIVGLFAIPEVVDLVASNRSVSRADSGGEVLTGRAARRESLKGVRDAFHHKWLMFRSSMVGIIIGIMPGVGANAAQWISYAQARQTEKGAKETFGKGDIRGILAADAPNNSNDGAELIPTMLFGIPGSAGAGIFLALIILNGYIPGPLMARNHLDLMFLLVFVVALVPFVVVPIMLYTAGFWAKFCVLRPNLIAPFIVAVTLLAAYKAAVSLGDLVVVAVFAALGLFMKAYGWPRPPILVAVVLSELLEKYLWISTNAFGFGMLTRPQFLAILFVMVALMVYSTRMQRSAVATSQAMASEVGKEPATTKTSRRSQGRNGK